MDEKPALIGATNASVFPALQGLQKWFALLLQTFFQSFRAITMAARPRFGTVFVPAISAVVRVLDVQQFEEFFPVRPFLGQWRIAKTGFHPVSHAVGTDARLLQVPGIFVTGDRALPERAVGQSLQQGFFPAGLYAGFDEITHSGRYALFEKVRGLGREAGNSGP